MFKLIHIVFLGFVASPCFAQVKLQKLDLTTLPKSISFKGRIIEAYRWQDKAGGNIVLLSMTDRERSPSAPDDDYRIRHLPMVRLPSGGMQINCGLSLKWKTGESN